MSQRTQNPSQCVFLQLGGKWNDLCNRLYCSLQRNLESCISEAKVVCAELKGATEAAKELKITLKLTPERQAVLDRSQDRILDKEKQMLSAHEKRNRDLIDSMQDDMVNRIRNYGGVWMSKRVFCSIYIAYLFK